jgi:hypothetical protein
VEIKAIIVVREKRMSDNVNSPPHYNQSGIECIDAIRCALGEEGFVAYCKGNNLKYIWRAQHKNNSEEDLEKAAWYSRMASGDDPRKDAGYSKAVLTGEDALFGEAAMVPPECDDRVRADGSTG